MSEFVNDWLQFFDDVVDGLVVFLCVFDHDTE